MKKIKVGLCSFGLSGRVFHAPLIEHLQEFDLTLILERNKDLSRELYPNAGIVRSIEEILHSEVDLIIVNGPSHLHYEWTKLSLEAGKHVVVEKPFVSNVREGNELIELSKRRGLFLSVYHNKRYESDYRTMLKLIQTNLLGKLKKVKITAHRYRPEIGPKKWKENNFPAAGLLYDIGSHLIDQTISIFGDAKSITGETAIQRVGGQVDDYFNLLFNYEDFEVELIGDMLTKENKPTMVIEGENGVFTKFGKDPQEVQLAQNPVNWRELGIEAKDIEGEILFSDGKRKKVTSEAGSYLDYYSAVYESIVFNKENPVLPSEALKVIEVIQQITRK